MTINKKIKKDKEDLFCQSGAKQAMERFSVLACREACPNFGKDNILIVAQENYFAKIMNER